MHVHIIYDKFLISKNKYLLFTVSFYTISWSMKSHHQSSQLNGLCILLVQNSIFQTLDPFLPPEALAFTKVESRSLPVLGLKTNEHKPCNLDFETNISHQSQKKY